MDTPYDREKVIDCMFDPLTSSILAELEDGEKDSLYLSKKSSIPETEVRERLSYLIQHGFIHEKIINDKSVLSADIEKLNEIVENNENFGAAVEGLEKMDSFLN